VLKSDLNEGLQECFALQQILYKPGTAILPDVGWSISRIRPLWATWEWRQRNVSQRQLLMPCFYTPFLEAINLLSSQRPHKFAILPLTFLLTWVYPTKTRLNWQDTMTQDLRTLKTRVTVSTEIWCSATTFNIDNNKKSILRSKSVY